MLRRHLLCWLLTAGAVFAAHASAQDGVRLGLPTAVEEPRPNTTIVQVGACAPCTASAPCSTGCGADTSLCNPARIWALFAARKLPRCEVSPPCRGSCPCANCTSPSCNCQATTKTCHHPRPILDALTSLFARDRHTATAPACGSSTSCGDLGVRPASAVSPAPATELPPTTAAAVPGLRVPPATSERLSLPPASDLK